MGWGQDSAALHLLRKTDLKLSQYSAKKCSHIAGVWLEQEGSLNIVADGPVSIVPVQDGRQCYAEIVAVRLATPGKLGQALGPSDFVQAHRTGCEIETLAAPTDMSALLLVAAGRV